MKFSDFKGASPWLKAADLVEDGGTCIYTIKAVEAKTFKDKATGADQIKPVITFHEITKQLICNAGNWRRLQEVSGGDDPAKLLGKRVVLFLDLVKVEGRELETIRVRAPNRYEADPEGAKAADAALGRKPKDKEISDDIPF